MLAKEHPEGLDKAVINAYQAQAAVMRFELECQIMQPGQRGKVLRQEAAAFDLSSREHLV